MSIVPLQASLRFVMELRAFRSLELAALPSAARELVRKFIKVSLAFYLHKHVE
jgi:hypothetical protein